MQISPLVPADTARTAPSPAPAPATARRAGVAGAGERPTLPPAVCCRTDDGSWAR